jgi:hypothetical protein
MNPDRIQEGNENVSKGSMIATTLSDVSLSVAREILGIIVAWSAGQAYQFIS